MKRVVWLLLLLVLVPLSFAVGPSALAQPEVASAPASVEVFFFWRENCRHCEAQKPTLARLAEQEPRVRILPFEVARDPEGRAVFLDLAERVGFEPSGVPVTVVGERAWVGFSPAVEAQIAEAVDACLASGCPDPRALTGAVAHDAPDAPQSIEVPIFGTIDLSGKSLWFSTALIAFVDGFNPCSLWVLSILLALVIGARSRSRILLIGGTFLVVTAFVYGMFIVGLFHVFALLSWIEAARVAVALFAAFFAAVNIKDYFWYKKGLSFTISDDNKPKIYKRIRKIVTSGSSLPVLLIATATMALGVSLMELPCTAGFPVLWTNMVAAHDVTGGTFWGLISLYMLIYLLDELLVFGTAVATLRMSRMQEKHGRVLKLVGGGVMLALAGVLIFAPHLMNELGSSLLVFGGAFVGVGLVLLVHRRILPRFGVVIGSEDL